MSVFTSALLNLANQFRILAFIEEDLAIETGGSPKVSVRRIPNRLTVSCMFLKYYS